MYGVVNEQRHRPSRHLSTSVQPELHQSPRPKHGPEKPSPGSPASPPRTTGLMIGPHNDRDNPQTTEAKEKKLTNSWKSRYAPEQEKQTMTDITLSRDTLCAYFVSWRVGTRNERSRYPSLVPLVHFPRSLAPPLIFIPRWTPFSNFDHYNTWTN